jgi:hypothetical protein
MFAEHISDFTRDFGVPCLYGAFAFTGILNSPDDVLNMGGVNVLSTMWLLECATADVVAGAIATNAVLVVDATTMGLGTLTFKVRDVLAIDDGAFKHLTLTQQLP